jgi:hypothetical protein
MKGTELPTKMVQGQTFIYNCVKPWSFRTTEGRLASQMQLHYCDLSTCLGREIGSDGGPGTMFYVAVMEFESILFKDFKPINIILHHKLLRIKSCDQFQFDITSQILKQIDIR